MPIPTHDCFQPVPKVIVAILFCRSDTYTYSGIKPYHDERPFGTINSSSARYASTSTSLSHVSGNNIKVSRVQCSTVPRVFYFLTTINTASISKIPSNFFPLNRSTESLIKDQRKPSNVSQCVSLP